ncbi:MAG: RNA polymerase sigma factor, partial [Mariniblastus sp.]
MTANIAAATDAQLIQRSRNGDESAFGEIVERYQSLACSVAYSRCGDLAISEDCAQEAFLQAWCKLADLKDVTKFKSWLCTIVRNLATRSHKQSARNVSSMAASLGTVAEPTSADIDPAERVVTAEEEQLVWQALAAIPENYREPMILFYREGQSVAKVAEALEISPDAVKQRLSRGRKFLQEQLAATVQSTLEKSKPAQGFTSAVIMGITGAKTKAATAGIVTSSAAKSVLGGSGFGGLIFISLAQLPLMAWLYKSAWAETRSSRERQLMVRFLIFWMLA